MTVSGHSFLTVILHYGSCPMTAAVHEQLVARHPSAHDIRVLDNASPQPYPHAWLRTERNLYWAGALALALNQARSEGFSHLWFLNNDVVFLHRGDIVGYARHRLQVAEARLGPVAVYSPAAKANPYHRHMVALLGGNFRRVGYVDGIAPLISVKYWEAVGLDYEDNPYGYGVDVFFSMQAPHLGWNLVVDHALVMRHRYHATARTVPGFLSEAARQERLFLTTRLGGGYRDVLNALSQNYEEY